MWELKTEQHNATKTFNTFTMSGKEWGDILALSKQHSFPYRKLIETGNNICQGTLCVNGSCSYILSSLNVLPLDALPSLPFHNNMQDKSPNAQTSHTLIISSCLMTFFDISFAGYKV